MRRVRLTEGQLHNIIMESVNQIENGMNTYLVYLRDAQNPGYGRFKVNASNEHDAVDKLVARLDKKGDLRFFYDDVVDCMDEDEWSDKYLIIDAGNDGPHWISPDYKIEEIK
jgi:hypothetical protein